MHVLTIVPNFCVITMSNTNHGQHHSKCVYACMLTNYAELLRNNETLSYKYITKHAEFMYVCVCGPTMQQTSIS
jgi:hypothetical protein